jgi:hypothetical protein
VATPDPLQKEREDLERQRKELEAEKDKLRKEQLAKDAGYGDEEAERNRRQGLTLYGGAGVYLLASVDKLNEYVRQDVGSGSGPVPSIKFPLDQAVGLRWGGFVLEYLHLDQGLSYKAGASSGGTEHHVKISVEMLAAGYDWAFLRRGGWLGPVELALPLRVYVGESEIRANGMQQNSHPGGPAFGLAVRYWPSWRFLLELQGLYHIQPSGDNNGGDSNSCGSCGGSGPGPGPASGPGSISFYPNTDGPEFRFNLGWRFF